MPNSFQVRVLDFSQIGEIEGARSNQDFADLLDAMDYGDQSEMSEDERREMCLMSLQDMEPEEAAYIVLKHDMGDVLRDGQMRNAANEMRDEKLWEEYADTALHERMFNAGSLLYAAFPSLFPEPDAVRVQLEVTAVNASARALLQPTPNESFLVRLLADGMDDHAILHRFYGDELKGRSFPHADEVIWIVRTESTGENSMKFDVISSGYWLDALEDVEQYESTAYPDDSPAVRS
ncbi:MAG: hypothetical protein O3B37_07300 [Proteobacteria bacterium]|nr:hypothetical protein [Pseudomonadota bacterium]